MLLNCYLYFFYLKCLYYKRRGRGEGNRPLQASGTGNPSRPWPSSHPPGVT